MKISVNNKELSVESVMTNINLNNKTKRLKSVTIAIDPSVSPDEVADFFRDNFNGSFTAITNDGKSMEYEGYPAVSISHFVDNDTIRFNVTCEAEPVEEY